ncbi:uncharacterized protein LOC134207222 [Armigeres subalbatus]|uniref:uncharacterized protein LOC134207222 n=1 Tax=Armigeres subalbatus TaxID=124917 RepID=UPI002ED53EEF
MPSKTAADCGTILTYEWERKTPTHDKTAVRIKTNMMQTTNLQVKSATYFDIFFIRVVISINLILLSINRLRTTKKSAIRLYAYKLNCCAMRKSTPFRRKFTALDIDLCHFVCLVAPVNRNVKKPLSSNQTKPIPKLAQCLFLGRPATPFIKRVRSEYQIKSRCPLRRSQVMKIRADAIYLRHVVNDSISTAKSASNGPTPVSISVIFLHCDVSLNLPDMREPVKN